MKAQPMNTSHYLLHPRAPLVFGTGKPLDFGLGGDSLNFPFPSTVAGALNAAHSAAQGRAPDPFAAIDGLNLQQLALARFNWLQPDVQPTLLLPRPADAVYIHNKMLSLTPQPLPQDSWTDLAPGLQVLALQGAAKDKKGKPDSAPNWWSADDFSNWLKDPKAQANNPVRSAFDTHADQRTHVVIDPHGKGATTGGLFRSTGRDFGPHAKTLPHEHNNTQSTLGYALAISTQEPQSLHGATNAHTTRRPKQRPPDSLHTDHARRVP
jgi:CRISPR-associated protein (Cas_Cmr3)